MRSNSRNARRVVRGLILICMIVLQPVHALAEATLQTFTLTDYLEHDWSNELVFFDLTKEATEAAAKDVSLLRPDGTIAACQFVETDRGRRVAFLADLPASKTGEYRLVASQSKSPATSLRVEKSANTIRLENELVGVEIRQTLEANEGPISGVRLRSGGWIGNSSLRVERPLVAYEATVTANGPVYAEVLVTALFEDDKRWTMRLRVIDGEPVVVVDETFLLERGPSRWELDLTSKFEPNHGIFRTSWYRPTYWPGHVLFSRPLFEGKRDPFVLLPWIDWSDGHQVSCVSLYREDSGAAFVHDKTKRTLLRQFRGKDIADALPDNRDVLFFAAGQAGKWARPGKDWGPDLGVPLKAVDGRAAFHFQLAGPARRWMLGTSTLENTHVPDADLMEAERYAIKHCGTSLQQVGDMTLVWGGADAAKRYPRVGFGTKQSEAAGRKQARKTLASTRPDRVFLKYVQAWDEANGQHIRRHDEKVWTHTICRPGFIPVVDAAMGSGFLTSEQFVTLRARLAFMGYKFGSPDFYSYHRGWRANPNMTTTRYSLVGLLGCLLADHPKAKDWYDMGSREVLRQLDEWVGPNGGWLESPHYQSLLGDGVMLLCVANRNGISDDVFHPNLLKTTQYLAKICTPPDTRFGNLRHLPAVGNTYRLETSGFFGILAKLYRKRNPEAAEALQWMWLQQGKPMWTGIGGGSGIASVMSTLVDDTWEDVDPPKWGSEVFPNSGTVLRSHFPGPRETYMYVLHGKFTQHYDNDRGSFSLWGKGQPLCLDWGYVEPYSSDMHNMLTSGKGVGTVAAFHTSDTADYLHVDRGPWQRQVLFLKDSSPEGPNFFVVRDTSSGNGRWHQWFYTKQPLAVDGDVVRMSGQADVDLDIWFANKRAAEFQRMTRAQAAEATERPPSSPNVAIGLESSSDLGLEDEEEATNFIVTRDVAKSCPTGVLGSHGSNELRSMRQRGLSLPVGGNKPVMVVCYPRLKSEAAPTFTELAGGRGVKVVSSQGVDYAFLSSKPFSYKDKDVQFHGVAGTIRIRREGNTMTLPVGGSIKYRGNELRSDPHPRNIPSEKKF